MAMDRYYQNPYVQNQIKFEAYPPRILMKPGRTSSSLQDYSIPLHVDCSVEYELPDCAKPPQGVKIEPLLMIHPCHFRNLERQRRRPFENNMPHNSLLNLEPPQQPKQLQLRNHNNNSIINNNNNSNSHNQKQQHHQQQIIPNNTNSNNIRNNLNNNFVYNCDFTAHIVDYHNIDSNNYNTNSSNNSNVQRYRNSGNNLIRNHPYAMPCAPKYPDIHYSTSHLPTLIYNV